MVQLRADRRKDRKRVRHALLVIGALVFCLSLLAVIVVWWLLNVYLPENQGQNSTPQTEKTPAFTQQDVFTTFLVLRGQKDCFLLIECDPMAQQVRVTGVPSNTAIDMQTQTVPLQSILARSGYLKAGEALESALNKEIRYKMQLPAEGMTAVLNDAGSSLEYTFREPISYTNEIGINVTYLADKRYSLSSHAVRELLNITADDTERAKLSAGLFAELVCQKMTLPSVQENSFRKLIDFVESNVRISDFVQVKSALQHLAQSNKGTIATATLLTGTQNGDLYCC